ncbi:MAG: hypothetical protein N2038_00640 [Geminicoccaceae bacterium]|nr:hypothetical protein [Geminicoccaceae bacterium]
MPSSIAEILQELEPERREILKLESEFAELIKKYDVRARKKNYGQRLSDLLARRIAGDLSVSFPQIEAGEKRAGGSKAPIRVDVRYHTKYGLGLGISIKTLNFRDAASGGYAKNMQRVDKELRAEAQELHAHQPKAVLGALILMPEDARRDGSGGKTSLAHALEVFRNRVGRADERGPEERFEVLFVGTYATDPERFGELALHDLEGWSAGEEPPPVRDWSDFLEALRSAFERRFAVRLKR